MSDRILAISFAGYRYLRIALSVGLITALLSISGCVSLDFQIEKNIYIGTAHDVEIKTSTKSELDTAAEITQDIKPDIKIPVGP